jgi:hypothetical protein
MPSTGFMPFKPTPAPQPKPEISGRGGGIAPIVGPGGQKPAPTPSPIIGPNRVAPSPVVGPISPASPSPVVGPLRPAPPLLLATRSTQPSLMTGNPKPVTNLLSSGSSLLGGLSKKL